jgi:hypothetical protein
MMGLQPLHQPRHSAFQLLSSGIPKITTDYCNCGVRREETRFRCNQDHQTEKYKLGKVATGYSEMLESFYQTTHRQAHEDSNFHYKELLPIMRLHYKQMTR